MFGWFRRKKVVPAAFVRTPFMLNKFERDMLANLCMMARVRLTSKEQHRTAQMYRTLESRIRNDNS